MEELKKFLTAVQEDRDLQKKVANAVKALPEGYGEDEISRCLIAVAKEAGYTVTMEDLAGMKELAAKANEEMELNVDEMAQAAGGFGLGITKTGCSGFGWGLSVNITSTGFGLCLITGGGKNDTACAVYGMGAKLPC